MESYKIENLTFSYPNSKSLALSGLSLTVNQGEFVTICGKSGCGKSTLLRLLKPAIAPYGRKEGVILFNGDSVSDIDFRRQSEKIGFVSQDPDSQIVTDKVWHELAFGLESLGTPQNEIRGRVAEIASFFGISNWFHKKTAELSGGQKQLLNLASVMVMKPDAIILDEPTSRLDPIAASEFLAALSKINRETGITVILAEHRLEETFVISDKIVVIDDGKIIAKGAPHEIGRKLKGIGHDMFRAMPSAVRIFENVQDAGACPVTVREARTWLKNAAAGKKIRSSFPAERQNIPDELAVKADGLWFRYEKNSSDIIKDLSLKVRKGEFYAIVGGNGSGKTTLLSLLAGINIPYRGKISLSDSADKNSFKDVGFLPQKPQTLFVKKTVKADLEEIFSDKKDPDYEKKIDDIVKICELDGLLERHPYDLSGGEQQRAALAKILLTDPKIILLDEPTKGLDARFKEKLAALLGKLQKCGKTIIMVSHDIEFCAEFSDRCAMFFDGKIVCEDTPREFFSGKTFYTTAANRISSGIIPGAVLTDDVIYALGVNAEKTAPDDFAFGSQTDLSVAEKEEEDIQKNASAPQTFVFKIIIGCIFAILFVVSNCLPDNGFFDTNGIMRQILSVFLAGISLMCLIPHRFYKTEGFVIQTVKSQRRLGKNIILSLLFLIIAIPATVLIGIYYFGDKKYYFISILIIFETFIPFFTAFEKRDPAAKELVVISVLCAIAVAGRAALYMLPQFKPVIAIVIISGVCFGGETGFLVGAVTGFISNFFLGQGPWTPWQMFGFGIIGFIAGVLFQKGILRRTRGALCVFGGLSTLIIYGGIMNPASVLMVTPYPTADMILSSYIMGFPFDLVHAVSTVFFLWFAAIPMIDKLERIKTKYGFLE